MIFITPAIKDRVLFYLLQNCTLEEYQQCAAKTVFTETETDYDTLRAILYQFEKLGFLSDVGVGHSVINLRVHAELHDFAHLGGFVMQEELLMSNIAKLELEVDALRKTLAPDQFDKLSKIATITGTLIAYAAFLKSK